MAVLAIAGAGALIGGAVGGWTMTALSMGWMVGSMAGQALFPPKQPNQQGPRLTDLKYQTSTYGVGIPQFFGTMRTGGNILWGLEIEERATTSSVGGGKKGGKGGGGKKGGPTITEYKYYWTGAVCFGRGPIKGIRRLLANGEPILDFTGGAKTEKYSECGYAIYLGDDDQMPDPVIEAHEGVGQTPAYRGRCYIRLEGLPLEDFGRRIPTFEAEIDADDGSRFVSISYTDLLGQTGQSSAQHVHIQLSPDGSWVYLTRESGSGLTRIVKLNALTREVDGIWYSEDRLTGRPTISADGQYIYAGTQGGSNTGHINRIDVGSMTLSGKCSAGGFAYISHGVAIGNHLFTRVNVNHPVVRYYKLGGMTSDASYQAPYDEWDLPGEDFVAFLADTRVLGSPSVWCLTNDGSTGWITTLFPDGRSVSSAEIDPSLSGVKWTGGTYDVAAEALTLIGYRGGSSTSSDWLAVSVRPSDMTLLSSRQFLEGNASGMSNMLLGQPITHGDFFLRMGGDLVRMDTRSFTELERWTSAELNGIGLGNCMIDQFHDRLWARKESGLPDGPAVIDLRGVQTVPMTLGDIVHRLCVESGLPSDRIDTSALTDPIYGYSRTRPMTARSAIEPLQQAYLFDAVETSDGLTGSKLVFRPKTATPSVSIKQRDLARNGDDVGLIEVRQQEVELPRRLYVNHLDPENGFQQSTQQAYLPLDTTDARSETTLDLPIAMTSDAAAKVAHRVLGCAWTERMSAEFNLPPRHMDVEPTDVVEIVRTDGGLVRVRVTETELGAGFVMHVKGVYADEAALDASGVVGAKGRYAPVKKIDFRAPTKLMLMNLPAMGQSSGQLGTAYMAAAPAVIGEGIRWNGAAILRSADGSTNWTGFAAASAAAPWGKLLSPPASNPRWGTWDGSEMVVRMASDEWELSGEPDIDVLNGANMLVVGNELLQFGEAELIAPRTYRLTRLLRGRHGTDDSLVHAAGEDVLVFDRRWVQSISSVEERGLSRYYVAATAGGGATAAVEFTNTSTPLKPYSPVHLKAVNSGTQTAISWVRRTRYNGDLKDNVDVPLNEDAESYQVDVRKPDGTLLRTISTATSSAVYTLAQYNTDAAAAAGTMPSLKYEVFQMSGSVGRGFGRSIVG